MPSFLDIFPNPAGFAALALAIPVVIVHFLKFQPPVMVVPSIRFWRAELAEPVANRFWQRIRDPFSLMLQLLALMLLSAALAGAQIPDLAAPPRSVVFVLDVSASMQAESEGVSRFERARDYLARVASEARGLDQFGLVTFGAEVRVVLPPSGNSADLVAIVRELRPTHETDDPEVWQAEVRRLWQAARERSEIVLLTGPATDGLLDRLSGEIGVVTFGAPVPNRGVILAGPRFDARTAASGGWVIDVGVAAHSPETAGSMDSRGDERPLLLERFDAASGRFMLKDARPGVDGFTHFALGPPGEVAGVWRVRFEQGDAMPADDAVAIRVAPQPAFSVAIVGAPGVVELESAERAAAAAGSDAPGKEFQLARLLRVLGATGSDDGMRLGTITVAKGAGVGAETRLLTYARDAWWDGLALESILVPSGAGLELTREWDPLLSVAGLPVAAKRRLADGSDTLTLSAGLLDSSEFVTSDTFLTLIGRWVRSSLRAKGIPESGPVASVSARDGTAITTPFVLSASETAEASQGRSMQRGGAAPMLPPAQDPWPLSAWLGLLALVLVGVDWWRYARRHGRRRRAESPALLA